MHKEINHAGSRCRVIKPLLTTSILTVALLLAIMTSCVPGLRSSKPVAQDPKSSGAAQSTGAQDPLIQPLPPPPPDFKEGESRRQPGSDPLELRQKEEINQAALKFAKEIPNVKHIKTCFSKIYGGWYLLLYLEAGKKISLQQYSWNDKSKEWDVVYHVKEVPAKQLEHHLKGEVGDERCFVLKK